MASTPRIPFNKPFLVGRELAYISESVQGGAIAGDGPFSGRCVEFFQERFGIGKVLMTPSCTAALEMAVMLCDLQPGDEVIMPSFTFVSTASAVARVGATPVFVDIRSDTLNLDENLVAAAITSSTKAIMPVHYAGVGCEMETLCGLAQQHGLRIIEDAAQGVGARYREQSLGSIGDLGTFSFHETKNFICGEGGAICVNRPELVERAEIIRDKGTNRKQFFRGEVDKYTWVDIGSSFLASDIVCAFLFAQLEEIEQIMARRQGIFEAYQEQLLPLQERGLLRLPVVPPECQSNHHMFYILLPDEGTRDALMGHLRDQRISAVFHYVPLHSSPMGLRCGRAASELSVTDDVSGRLLRLPFYFSLAASDQARVVAEIRSFFGVA